MCATEIIFYIIRILYQNVSGSILRQTTNGYPSDKAAFYSPSHLPAEKSSAGPRVPLRFCSLRFAARRFAPSELRVALPHPEPSRRGKAPLFLVLLASLRRLGPALLIPRVYVRAASSSSLRSNLNPPCCQPAHLDGSASRQPLPRRVSPTIIPGVV